MSQRDREAENFADLLIYAGQAIRYYQRVSSYNDCYTCAGGKDRSCPYLPDWGEPTRINCPLWYSEKKEE